MIPAPGFSPVFYLLVGLGFLACVALSVWLGLLIVVPGARVAFRRHLRKSLVLVVLLTVLAAFFGWVRYQFWRVQYDAEKDHEARHFTLSQARQVDGIAMPAGTRLSSKKPHDPAFFDEAVFPSPTPLWGTQALQLRRFMRYDLDLGIYVAEQASVGLAADQRVQDWLCSQSQPVEFQLLPREEAPAGAAGGEPPVRFQACELAAGNHVGPWPVPAGARVQASRGTVWTDNTRGSDRWMIRIEPDKAAPMPWLGTTLRSAMVYLDAQRALLRVDDGELAADWRLGPMHHRAGERVRSAPEPWQSRFPGALMFSPVQGQTAAYQGHADLSFGSTAIQTPDGRVHAIVPNAEAGVLEFATIMVR